MPRDGTKNLIPMDRRSKDEAKEMGTKGGKKSGETRRRQRDARKALEQVMKACPEMTPKAIAVMQKMGVKGKGRGKDVFDLMTISMAALANKCSKGDVQAIRLMTEILGQDARSTLLHEQMEHEERLVEMQMQPAPVEESPAYNSFMQALNEKAGETFDAEVLEDIPAGIDDTPNAEDDEL